MKKATKIWLIIAAFLILTGMVMFSIIMSIHNWNFTKLSTAKYESNTYEIVEHFENISIKTDTANIEFKVSDNEKCIVKCYENNKLKHSAIVENNTLVIKPIDNRSWYEYIGFNFDSPKLTIYLPKTEYNSLTIDADTSHVKIPKEFGINNANISLSTGNINFFACASGNVKLKTSTGKMRVENTSAKTFDISSSTGLINISNVKCEDNISITVSTGKIEASNILCKNFTSDGNTGDIFLNNVVASNKLSIKRSTGDIKFSNSDAEEIFVETDTGDVEGILLTNKIFTVTTDTGKIDIPKTSNGGKCEIITDTGDVKISIEKSQKTNTTK